MLHFLLRLVRTARRDFVEPPPARITWTWAVTAFAAVTIPWALFPAASGGSSLQALLPGSLWAGLWPALIGAVLAVGLGRWQHRLPRVPEGDLVVVGETAARATITWAAAVERVDAHLRQWPVASLALLTLVIILSAAMLAWDKR
jgi:hypothetical protein